MARADYKLCAICYGKTFYDCDMDFDKNGNYLGTGQCESLCVECSKEWELRAVKKGTI